MRQFANLVTKPVLIALACLPLIFVSTSGFCGVGGYKKSTEGDDVIKNKAYPKKGRLELNGPNLGLILNQSYINTYLVNAGANYFWDEAWGLGLDFSFAINQDKEERKCIESFYNDPDYDNSAECASQGPKTSDRANYGPAYVNIREYKYMFAANGIWNPIYGKEIFFLSGVVNFDIFMTMGGGLAMTKFYPMSTTLKNGKASRGEFPAKDQDQTNAPGTNSSDEYGPAGRPTPVNESKVFLDGGIGQKVHFAQKFNFKVELRDHIVIGTPGGFDMFFTLWGGLGMRF